MKGASKSESNVLRFCFVQFYGPFFELFFYRDSYKGGTEGFHVLFINGSWLVDLGGALGWVSMSEE